MKTMISALFALCVFASSVWAVSLQVVDSNSEFILFNQGGTQFSIDLDTLRKGNLAHRTADLLSRIQTFTHVRLDKTAIVELDEPTRMVDPGRLCGPGETMSENECGFGERSFWCQADGTPIVGDQAVTTHVCAQSDVVTNIIWDDVDQKFVLTIRNAVGCDGNPDFPSCQ